jgi:adenylate cyclase
MATRPLTLGRALGLGLGLLALGVAVLFTVVLGQWGVSLLKASERLREAASARAEAVVGRTLGGAEAALRSVARQVRSGALDPGDPASVERALFAQLLGNDDLAEATLTTIPGAGAPPWQVSVFRGASAPQDVTTAFTHRQGPGFVADLRPRPLAATRPSDVPFTRAAVPADDPTEHLTYRGAVSRRRFSSDPLWTDLHYAERDSALPEAQRRVVATVMGVVEDGAGQAVGVVRIGVLADRLDEVARLRVDPDDPADPHRVFLADDQGRLVTRLAPGQALEDQDGDVRPSAAGLPDEVRAALAHASLRDLSADHPRGSARLSVGGRTFLLSTLLLKGAQDWRVATVVPEDHYLGALRRTRNIVVAASAAALLLALVVGGAALASVQRSLGRVVASTTRMSAFDFAPSPAGSSFRDLAQVLDGLEQSKTALRAMGKYVPVDLVRQLFRARREPVLGGEMKDVTLMFTDVEGFTTVSERLTPDVLATALGRYFEVMTSAVHHSGGIVDKYIGDAVMALWNAPETQPDHPAAACGAALRCVEATAALFASPEWGGLPALRTRFGLHRDEAMVGHFGAPDRISYTALGDGVNLASRLEGLNKAYGTTILVSEAVRDAASDRFSFRLVDVVKVKGKTRGTRVYELLGEGLLAGDRREVVRRYEAAFEVYQRRGFAEAAGMLQAQAADPPSRVLAERCHRLAAEAPGEDWDGVHAALEK